MGSIASKSINASVWSLIEAGFRYVFLFLTSMVLARLLTPEDFGLIAIVLVFTSICTIFSESGLNMALIQRQNTSVNDETTIFIFSLFVSIVLAVILGVSASVIAGFFEQPLLEKIIPVMALSLPLGSLSSVPDALLIKKLAFKKRALAEIIVSSLSAGCAIYMAFEGWGVWSLVWQGIISSALKTVALFALSGWMPRGRYCQSSFRALFRFGGYTTATILVCVFTTRLQSLLIGRLVDLRALGLYTFAQNTQSVPISISSIVFSRVFFPVFSSIAHDKDRLAEALRRTTRLSMFLFMPLMFGMAIFSRPLLETLYGSQWVGAAPIFCILAIGSSIWPIYHLNCMTLLALNHPKYFFRLELIKLSFFVMFFPIFLHWGIIGISIAIALANLGSTYVSIVYTNRLISYGVFSQFRDNSSTFLCVLGALFVYLILNNFLVSDSILYLATSIFFSVVAYFALALLINRQVLHELQVVVNNTLNKPRKASHAKEIT